MSDKLEKSEEEFRITTNWANRSQELKDKYPALTNSDIKFEPGDEKYLIQRIASRLNKTEGEVIFIIKSTL